MTARRIEDWTVEDLVKRRPSITFPDYQREKTLWPPEKKSKLIDSLINDFDIPKLYFNERDDGVFEVIDGQQRLWSVWEFVDGVFPYLPDRASTPLYFSEMATKVRDSITNYTFQVVIFENADDSYLRELFLRLQLGFLLNTGEKLHAATGRMKEFVFDTMAGSRFVRDLGVSERRYAKPTLCAQIAINSFYRAKVGQFARTRYEDLLSFFTAFADPKGDDQNLFDNQGNLIAGTLKFMHRAFGDRAGELSNRSFILSLYLLAEEGNVGADDEGLFVAFVFKLWSRMKQEAKRGMDRTNRDVYSFQSLLSSAPGERYQIERRHETLKDFFAFYKETRKIKGDR